jgi:alkylation response protein AidB-like acyl-CoA dehydrogenase
VDAAVTAIVGAPHASASATPVAPPPLPEAVARSLRAVGDTTALRVFPRAVLAVLGQLGVLRRRWSGGVAGDVRYGTDLAEEAARQAFGGVAVGISVHTEPVLAMLHRFGGESAYLTDLRERALAGEAIGCVAASEPAHGSDLSSVTCLAVPMAGGWRITGEKKYVSLGAAADFVIVLCRVADDTGEATPRLAVVVVPREQVELVRVHDKVGAPALDTVALSLRDVLVPRQAMLGRPGLGLAVLSYGLSFERLAVAAGVTGACELSLSLAVEHSERRTQFGRPLRAHQYLEFRMAELWAELEVLRAAVHELAGQLTEQPLDRLMTARIAAVKRHAAKLGERLVSECLQIFGGAGYLPAETPLGQFWRDIRLARIGGGTDEMMLALAAGELRGDPEAYDRHVRISP